MTEVTYKRVARGQYTAVWPNGRPVVMRKGGRTVVLTEVYFGNANEIMETINRRLRFIQSNGVTLL